MIQCKHRYVWPDGVCVECDVLATTMPGKTEPAHLLIPRETAKISRKEWISLFGGEEIAREKLRVVPCACTGDTACKGWQVVYPNQLPSNPVRRPPNVQHHDLAVPR
jgi:hypothetical protein